MIRPREDTKDLGIPIERRQIANRALDPRALCLCAPFLQDSIPAFEGRRPPPDPDKATSST